MLWTSCCVGRTTAWLTGEPPTRNCPTGGSSTSRRSPGCGWKTKSCSPTPTVSSLSWSPTGHSTGCGSTTWTGSLTPRATCAGCVMPPAGPMSWSRRSSRRARGCYRPRRQRAQPRRDLRDTLRETIAAFPVYRTYARPGRPVTEADRAHVAAAVAAARQRRPDLDGELIEFIGELLVLHYPGEAEADFALRFAQVSAPVMAKGVEDTAFYRYQPLVSLNEVGGGPGRFGSERAEFHQAMSEAAERWPEAMLTLSTHDTKRSGDMRARLNVLSELPEAWEHAAERWAHRNKRYKHNGWPERNAEYLLYQSLVGAWPIDAGRGAAFMAKAAKEAKACSTAPARSVRWDANARAGGTTRRWSPSRDVPPRRI